ncbi:hypothetical protein GQ55_1G176700 [Panicum hallii var. hallii]|uniref:Secreted protein n=1 Tax=Panicum hallii var. hallii TaxID=1504633 RepID=A0A2T7F5Y8_9POAL|nr:hypothetical protein GQ55_1G176700 [Panicum hallii var. hallii]
MATAVCWSKIAHSSSIIILLVVAVALPVAPIAHQSDELMTCTRYGRTYTKLKRQGVGEENLHAPGDSTGCRTRDRKSRPLRLRRGAYR